MPGGRIVAPAIRRRKGHENSVIDTHAFANERQHGSGMFELAGSLLVHGGENRFGTWGQNSGETICWRSAEKIEQRIAAEAWSLVVVGQGIVRWTMINAERRIILPLDAGLNVRGRNIKAGVADHP